MPLSWFVPPDWVDVANELLVKCRIEQKLTKLTDCDAHVFISLYENILREKVPGKMTTNGLHAAPVWNDCTV